MVSKGLGAPGSKSNRSPSSRAETSAARMASNGRTSLVQSKQPSTDELRDALRSKLMMKSPPHKHHFLTAQIKRELAASSGE